MLSINIGTLFNLLNILVLFIFLKMFMFKPVVGMLEKRAQTIRDSLDTAENKKLEAMKMKDDFEAQLSTAKDEATKIINASRKQAEIEYKNRMKEFEDDKARKMEEFQKQMEMERAKMMQGAQAEISTLALLAASKIISKNVDSSVNRQMIGDFIKEVGAAK